MVISQPLCCNWTLTNWRWMVVNGVMVVVVMVVLEADKTIDG